MPPRFHIYKITNLVNGRAYIGVTTATVKFRWESHIRATRKARGSKQVITRAIMKYGPDAFVVEHIASARNKEDMLATERLLIVQEGTKGPAGYNSTDGGDRLHNPTAEVRAKLAAAATGKRPSTETCARRSASVKNAWKSRPAKTAEEYKEILAKSWVQRRLNGNDTHVVSEETKAKMSASKTGKTFDDEFKAKVSAGLRRWIAENGSHWTGRKHTDETRAKLVAAWALRKARAADTNLRD